jgi:hypothetical protein
MIDYYNCSFPNFGFVGAKLTEEEFAPILAEVAEIQEDFAKAVPMQKSLVGQLAHEYKMVKNHDHLEKLARNLIGGFAQAFSYKTRPLEEYKAGESWVNFQRKGEFNPLHSHSGNFSYVLWVNIPYTIEEEKEATSYVLEDRNCSGNFTFQYLDVLGCINPWAIPADKTYEGTMILFPALLNHQVHPFFSSDGYRISISGNLGVVGDAQASRVSFGW